MYKEYFTNSPYSIQNATNITILYSKLKVSLSLGSNDRLDITGKLGIRKSQLLWVLLRLNPIANDSSSTLCYNNTDFAYYKSQDWRLNIL